MTPFQTQRDDGVPLWRITYDLFRTLPYGELVTYEQLNVRLGFDVRLNRHPIYRADQELRQSDQRALVAAAGQGYRVLHPNEQEAVAQGHRRKSVRSMRRAVSVAQATNLLLVDADQRVRLDAFVRWGVGVMESLEYSHRRHEKTERLVADIDRRLKVVEGDPVE